MFPYKQENQISREQQVTTTEDHVQEGNKVLKPKPKWPINPENNCIPLKADGVISSEIHNLKDNIIK